MPDSQTPPARKRHWVEYAASGAALLISAISLWVGIGTEDANRQMVAASSLPMLEINTSNAGASGATPTLRFQVINAGVGPAKIETFEVFYKGNAMHGSRDLLVHCCGYHPPKAPVFTDVRHPGEWTTGDVAPSILRAGETREFLTYPESAGLETIWRALDRTREHDLDYRVCYCSVFDDCWLSDMRSLNPAHVDKCPVPAVGYFD